MIKIDNKSKCVGCYACYSICPKKCIQMINDNEGFKYPIVDTIRCINCNMCIKVCPMINPQKDISLQKTYAAYNKDESIRMKSSSGGLFSIFAKEILKQGGVVFGAMFDNSFNVVHSYIKTEDELLKFQGSKYVQSSIGDTYKKCKEFLEQGRLVYFTGTPCQINGLKQYLRKEYTTLLTQDFVCHGVPSPKVWNDYKTRFKNIENVSFRDKTNGWIDFNMKINDYNVSHSTDSFMIAFLTNNILRPSCYECKFKTKDRVSDITLADLWGATNIVPEMDDDKGLSLLVINSDKGLNLFERVKSNMVYKQISLDLSIVYNSAYIKSVRMPNSRKKVMKQINSNNFDKIVKKYCKSNFAINYLTKCKRLVKKLFKKFLKF